MKHILILLILSSCTLTYYYRVKDIDNNNNKMNKEINKSLKTFNKLNDIDDVILKMEKSSFPNKKQIISEVKGLRAKCYAHKDRIQALQNERLAEYKSLKISRKKKYSQKDSKYSEIQAYIDSHKDFEAKINTEVKSTNNDCNKIEKGFEKFGVKLMNANVMFSKFESHKKELISSDKKITKQLRKFEKQVKNSKHKNKKKIQTKLKEVRPLLSEVKAQANNIGLDVTKLKKLYGDKGNIPVVKGSEAFKALENLSEKTGNYSNLISKFNGLTSEINELTK